MELLNATKMQAGYTMGMRPDGRELLVVVVKGTFLIPKTGEEAKLAPEQIPLVMADTFTGEPGLSATIYESEYAPTKPRCDVLLLGSAYAPRGKPTERVSVSLRVGSMLKKFDVVGNRVWKNSALGLTPSRPQPFTVMPISYDNAYGGFDNLNPDPAKHQAYFSNTVGKGYFPSAKADMIEGKPLPNSEEPGNPVTKTVGSYRPMAFGPIGRGWQPRLQYAGTYDQNWIDNVFPFLPADFDERYYQSVPPDQQTDYLKGDELVELVNLSPRGRESFKIPKIEVSIRFYLKNNAHEEFQAVADALVIEPDFTRFSVLWRASRPLRRNIFEVAQIVVGRMPRGWYRARELGKTWYPSLKGLIDERRANREEASTEEAEIAEEEA